MFTNFICTNKDFTPWEDINKSILVCTRTLKNQYPYDTIEITNHKYMKLQRYYAEGLCINNCYDNLQDDNDIIGICLYYAHFENIDLIMQDNEVILPYPYMYNMEAQYAQEHNLEDLRLCEEIIDELFPEYHQPYEQINGIYPYNMFIMKNKDFKAYCNFVFTVIDEFLKRKVFYLDEDIDIYISQHPDLYPGGIDGQNGMLASLMERIGTIFFMTYFKDYTVHHAQIILNEK
ncbi:MAG: hypothetical protein [Wendovervirus sonii]|uniref:DUF4422 domain-containing protein n=1 Tax=phage Lak_Megaphage_Sonny TaxID=3109229 RepID=A0ABZ0Z3Q5_9CAUD|nr:MAG: hypothetical protein [phage Lak_Megaphage_Sonny]